MLIDSPWCRNRCGLWRPHNSHVLVAQWIQKPSQISIKSPHCKIDEASKLLFLVRCFRVENYFLSWWSTSGSWRWGKERWDDNMTVWDHKSGLLTALFISFVSLKDSGVWVILFMIFRSLLRRVMNRTASSHPPDEKLWFPTLCPKNDFIAFDSEVSLHQIEFQQQISRNNLSVTFYLLLCLQLRAMPLSLWFPDITCYHCSASEIHERMTRANRFTGSRLSERSRVFKM